MRSESEQFVLEMVRACMPKTASGIRFDYGTHFIHQSSEHGGNGACSGTMSISIHCVEPHLNITYSLLGAGDGVTWTSGRCTITISGRGEWEFYCDRQANKQLRVRTMVVMRRCRVLKRAVCTALDGLGNTPEAIARQLQKLGYEQDAEGLKQFVAETFMFTDTLIIGVDAGKPKICARHDDNPDLDFISGLSSAMTAFIALN